MVTKYWDQTIPITFIFLKHSEKTQNFLTGHPSSENHGAAPAKVYQCLKMEVHGRLSNPNGMVEFEDCLMTESSLEPAGTIVVTALSPRSIHIHSLGVG